MCVGGSLLCAPAPPLHHPTVGLPATSGGSCRPCHPSTHPCSLLPPLSFALLRPLWFQHPLSALKPPIPRAVGWKPVHWDSGEAGVQSCVPRKVAATGRGAGGRGLEATSCLQPAQLGGCQEPGGAHRCLLPSSHRVKSEAITARREPKEEVEDVGSYLCAELVPPPSPAATGRGRQRGGAPLPGVEGWDVPPLLLQRPPICQQRGHRAQSGGSVWDPGPC